jgi:hypothetical protein
MTMAVKARGSTGTGGRDKVDRFGKANRPSTPVKGII